MEKEDEDEDEEVMAQWAPICDDCDDPVEHRCTTCGDNLCSGCKDKHLSRQENRGHQVVPYSSGMRAMQKSRSRCPSHPGESFQLYCKTCKVLVCTLCIAQSHPCHLLIGIPDALSAIREQALATLRELTTKIRPSVKDGGEKLRKLQDEAQEKIATTEREMRSKAKQLHEIVDDTLTDNLQQLKEIKERSIFPKIEEKRKENEDLHRHVEKAISEYEGNLRSSDPINLITFMNERGSAIIKPLEQPMIMQPLAYPQFQGPSISQRAVIEQFGSIVLLPDQNIPLSQTQTLSRVANNTPQAKRKSNGETVVTGTMLRPERLSKFALSEDHFTWLGALKYCTPDKIWISGYGTKIFLVERDGKVLRSLDVKCTMYDNSGMYCHADGELIFCDVDGKQVRKISSDFRITTLFSTGSSKPRGLCQLKNGDFVICMRDKAVARVYDRDGKVLREVGKGRLQKPLYVTVNKVNDDDICISDNWSQVVVFNNCGEKRFNYTGDRDLEFDPYDLCSDQHGNILITDCKNNRVHIIDRDGHFLQYLVSGTEDLCYPISVDIDDRGFAWIGEHCARRANCFKYVS